MRCHFLVPNVDKENGKQVICIKNHDNMPEKYEYVLAGCEKMENEE